MHKWKGAWCICRMTCVDYLTSLRFWIVILCAAILGYYNINAYEQTGSLAEVLLLSFSNFYKYLLVFSVLLVFLGKAPFFAQNDQFLISRTTRRSWILGKILFVALVLVLFYILMFGVILTANFETISFTRTGWSPPSDDLQLYKFIELGEPLLATYSPLTMVLIFLPLSYLLMFSFSLIVVLFNIWYKRFLGFVCVVTIFASSGAIYSISEEYARWGLILQATPYYHRIPGYIGILRYGEAGYPTVLESVIVFIVLTLLLLYSVIHAIKRYDIHQHDKEV